MDIEEGARRAAQWALRWAGVVIAIIIAILTVVAGVRGLQDSTVLSSELERQRLELQVQRQRQQAEAELRRAVDSGRTATESLKAVQRELTTLKAQLGAAGTAKFPAIIGAQVADTKRTVDAVITQLHEDELHNAAVEKRLTDLETAVITDPPKALAVPLIRRDLDALRLQAAHDVETLKAENSRVYDLMRWLIGLMALVSLGLIGTAVGNVFKREPKEVVK